MEKYVERIEAFIKLGRPDPVQYADETGPVDYETARIYVEQVLSEHAKEQFNKVRTSNKLNIK